MSYLIWFILIAIAIWICRKFTRQFKLPKIGSMALISGGVKTGKSTLAVALTYSEWKKRRKSTKIQNFFAKIFRKPQKELPVIYSNIPLTIPYVPLTEDLILRKKRFIYGSVIYICEASLIADSRFTKETEVNNRLLLFNKLIGHETKGGCLIYDTQTVSDCHYSIKRCLSEYIYIHHLTKWIPFFLIAHVQECRYSEDNSVITADTEDVENKLRKVIIRKKTWKMFDCYCYSYLTDNLPEEKEVKTKTKDLKAKKIISFNPEFAKLKGEVKNEKETN